MRSMSAPPGTLGCAWIGAAAGPWSVALWQLTPLFAWTVVSKAPQKKAPATLPPLPFSLAEGKAG